MTCARILYTIFLILGGFTRAWPYCSKCYLGIYTSVYLYVLYVCISHYYGIFMGLISYRYYLWLLCVHTVHCYYYCYYYYYYYYYYYHVWPTQLTAGLATIFLSDNNPTACSLLSVHKYTYIVLGLCFVLNLP